MRLLVAYRSKREGTAGVSSTVADTLRKLGLDVDVFSASEVHDPSAYDAVVVSGAEWRDSHGTATSAAAFAHSRPTAVAGGGRGACIGNPVEEAMGPVAVIYATREGQTRLIAERLAEKLSQQGAEAYVFDAALSPQVELGRYAAAILAASVHVGKHEREMVRFVARHRADLERIPTAFLSISLSAAGVEANGRTPDQRAKAVAEVKRIIESFVQQTGWRPTRIEPVAGALLYTRYGWLVRGIMKRIAKAAGGDTDVTRDYVYTDWAKLDHLAGELAARLAQKSSCLSIAAPTARQMPHPNV